MDLIAGVDEAGRGPLVGNVVAAAVILNPGQDLSGVTDSKKISEKKRESLYDKIITESFAYNIVSISPAEIDDLNILQATMLAMTQAVNGLSVAPTLALIDGNKVPQGLKCQADAIVKGDSLHLCIGAASILAKVTRDRQMRELDAMHPEYGFASHKGYPTKTHIDAIAKYGILNEHRRSYGPVKKALAATV